MPTASEFSRLVTSKGAASASLSGYAHELAGELFAGMRLDAFDGNTWTTRGQDLEEEAGRAYAFDRDVEITPCGFVTNDENTAGGSPDGLVGDDGLIEIKCLKAENHLGALTYYKKHNTAPSGYIQQTQGYLMLTGRKWIDLVFYHPNLPLHIIRQEPDAEFQAALRKGIKDVCQERDDVLATMRHDQQHIPESAK
jgi:hypothetical protein